MIIHTRIEGTRLAGNLLDDPTERDLFVYLPPRYDESERRYPTAYLLHAYGDTAELMVTPATDGERWRPPIEDVLDPVFGRVGVAPMIVVIPDGNSRYGCGQWVDSPVTGSFEQFVLHDVIPHVDATYRTLPAAQSRGVFGFSSGGFGAWNLASRNPDVFGATAVLSADSWLDMTHKFMLYKYLDSIWPEAPNGPVEGNFWSEIVYDYAATYSPNPDNPPFYVDLPMAWPSGELIQEVWARWLGFDPVVNVHDRLDNLRKLSGILLDAGWNDDYNLHWGHRLLSHHLTEARIPHEHRENPGNHGGRANERYQVALEWLSQVLDGEVPHERHPLPQISCASSPGDTPTHGAARIRRASPSTTRPTVRSGSTTGRARWGERRSQTRPDRSWLPSRISAQDVWIRIGVHVGEVIVEPERLTGEAVNIAARIESFAVAGGVMLSDSAYDQIKNRSDVGVVRLGRFRLKNVGRPFELFAVSADGIVVPDAEALEGKGERFASLPSNLPDPVSPLIGRVDELASLVELTREHRVVTITGPGGVGKTRLLVELGRMLSPEFLDGVAFVGLADVTDAAQFLATVADTLDVKEADGRTLGDGIAALIADRKALLLLDNLEQIVSAAPDIARLVEGCPELLIVTTSRTPLRIAAEHEYPLAPLGLPRTADSDAPESLVAYPAIALFVDRARTTRDSFALTPQNAEAVAAICRRLDGLPLALELAAARVRILSPEALLERLDHALQLLTSGSRDRPQRQQTLRATIDWSHSLLTDLEQRLFRRMAVFAGGCTYADAEAICGDTGEMILDELESLVDKALVQTDGQGDRLRMLQTIGEYALDQLDDAGERAEIALRHARRYAELAHEIRDGIEGTDQIRSVVRGIAEEGNLQAALDTFLQMAHGGDAQACEAGLQLCGDLYFYWHIRGKNLTAREYAATFIEADSGAAPTLGRAGALITAGLACWILGQFERADEEWVEAYRIAAELGADRELCISAFCRALSLLGSDVEAGLRWTAESIERSRAVGFPWAEALALAFDGILHGLAGDADTARARYSDALAIQKRLGDAEGAGLSLGGLAQLAAAAGDLPGALDLYRQSLAAFEACGDRLEEARILDEMAWTHLRHRETTLARRHFLDAVQAYTDVGSVRGVGLSLIGLAATEAEDERPARAVQIAAAAEVYAQQEGIVNVYSDETPGREFVDQARAELSADEVARATEVGRRLTINETLDLARAPDTAAA